MRLRLVLVSLVLLATLPLAAQQPPAGAGDSQIVLTPEPSPPPPAIESLQFGGGSLAELVEIIRGAHRGPLNIVVDPDADRVALPALTLRSVSVSAALKVAQAAAKGPIKVSVQRISEGGDQEVFVIRVDAPASQGKGPSATALGGSGGGGPTGALPTTPEPRARRLEVISLRALLTEGRGKQEVSETLKTALTAIEEALQLAGKNEELPAFKVHGESGLLFVRGSEDQLDLVHKVIQEMTPRAMWGGKENPSSTIARLKDEVDRLKQDLEALSKAYNELLSKSRTGEADGESKPVQKAPAR